MNPAPVPYACNHCGTVIFTSDRIVDRRPLWDLGEYRSDCYLITAPHDWASLRRYDASLHQGWYCCRFILMRMTQDKFGTGDALIVYSDSVQPLAPGTTVSPPSRHPALRLTADDFDTVLTSPGLAGRIAVVKLGAIWCPPCRLTDQAIARVHERGQAEDVDFFEVDVDEQPELAARFPNRSIPYTLLYWNGRPVPFRSDRLPVLDGGILGGLGTSALTALLTRARSQLLAGRDTVTL